VGLAEGNKPQVFQFNCFAFYATGEASKSQQDSVILWQSLFMMRVIVIA